LAICDFRFETAEARGRVVLPCRLTTFRRLCLGPIALLLFLFQAVRCPAANEPAEIPIEIVGKVIFVKGEVNERKPFTLILDTGATETVLTPAAAERAGVKAAGSGGQRKGLVKSISAAGVTARNLTVCVFDPPQALSLRLDKGMDYHGILGYTFLSRFVTTIDYKRLRVRFVPTASYVREDEKTVAGAGKLVVPFQLNDDLIHAKAEVNGKTAVTFVIDTGSAEVVLLPQSAASLGIEAASLPGYEGIGHTTLDSISLAGARAFRVPVIIHAPPQERRSRPGYDGILGYPFLSNFVVTVNYRDKVLVLEPAGKSANGDAGKKIAK